jgi:hypothetical protein
MEALSPFHWVIVVIIFIVVFALPPLLIAFVIVAVLRRWKPDKSSKAKGEDWPIVKSGHYPSSNFRSESRRAPRPPSAQTRGDAWTA